MCVNAQSISGVTVAFGHAATASAACEWPEAGLQLAVRAQLRVSALAALQSSEVSSDFKCMLLRRGVQLLCNELQAILLQVFGPLGPHC